MSPISDSQRATRIKEVYDHFRVENAHASTRSWTRSGARLASSQTMSCTRGEGRLAHSTASSYRFS